MASSLSFPHQPISENPFPSTIVSSSSISSHIGRSIGLPVVTSRVLPLRVSRGSSGKVRAAEISNQTRGSTNLRSVDLQMTEVPLLSSSEVVERLKTYQENRKSTQHYLAMYSSIFGGITTDPAAMIISLDDHMVHRGHGVFDTAAIMDGHLYELDQHIDRFLKSASMAKIALPFDPSSIRNVLIQTVSASKCTWGSLRYWLSAGPGDFQLSPSGCSTPALYAVVYQDQSPPYKKGVKVITSSISMKPPQFAIMKSVNYLPNVLSKMEAEDKGAFAAIWLDDEGNVAEGPNMNVAFVTTNKELVMPYFDNILSGCTAKRVVVLAKKLVKEGRLAGIRVGDITMQEGKMAEEMMLIGSGILVLPVLQWDEQIIGNGKEGPVAQELLELIQEDMKAGPSEVRIPIPY